MEAFFVVLALAYLIMVPAALIVALSANSNFRSEVTRLTNLIDQLGHRVRDLENRVLTGLAAEDKEQKSRPVQTEAAAPEPTVSEPTPEITPVPEAAMVQEAAAKPAPAKSALPPVVPLAAKAKTAFAQVEQDLSSRWMMWVGGLALALGGAFLVKYSIDAGLLEPPVRIALGVLFGLLLGVGR